MASAVAMMIGGAVVNALAFSGSNYLFSHMGNNSSAERERHDKAVEQLQASQAAWSKKEQNDWTLLMKKYKRSIMQSRHLIMLTKQ